MYEWLGRTLQSPAVVLTANRRLARLLQEEYGRQQVAAGKGAWKSAEIFAWQDWLQVCLASSDEPGSLPTRINPQHAQILWERCLTKELGDNATGVSTLARSCRDAWQRAADACLSIKDIARTARSDDHRLFASVAGRYLGILEREDWVDAAGVNVLVRGLFQTARIALPERLVLAGFDREPASLRAMCDVLSTSGCQVERVAVPQSGATPLQMRFDDVQAEMRAAGAWAREVVEKNPAARAPASQSLHEQQDFS
ncbi:MAG: hypothetical protein AAFN50_06970, partial [Pseudomonadota bacterium]